MAAGIRGAGAGWASAGAGAAEAVEPPAGSRARAAAGSRGTASADVVPARPSMNETPSRIGATNAPGSTAAADVSIARRISGAEGRAARTPPLAGRATPGGFGNGEGASTSDTVGRWVGGSGGSAGSGRPAGSLTGALAASGAASAG